MTQPIGNPIRDSPYLAPNRDFVIGHQGASAENALKAGSDEEAGVSLCQNGSRPYLPPSGCKRIVVKVINYYDDEVVKVFDV